MPTAKRKVSTRGKKTGATTARRKVDKVAAAEAARRYRERRAKIGYVSMQVWVPQKYRAELLDLVHERLEQLQAIEEQEREAVLAEKRTGDDSPRRARRRVG